MFGLNNYRIRPLNVGVVVVMILTSGNVSADYAWTKKAEMPIKRIHHSTSVVAGKIYVIGGLYTIGEWNPQWEVLTRVDEYDPLTDTWTRKADMPTVRAYTSTSVVNDKIYVFGDLGDKPVPIVEVYDPATDTWIEQTELPTKRRRFTTSVVDGKIYVIGGAWTREVVEAYDPATDTWTTKSPMPTPRYGLKTVVVDGKIYAIGGWYHSINGPIYSTVEVYDPLRDTWMEGIDIPVTTAEFSASVVNGKIHVIGGTVETHRGEHWVLTSAVYTNEPIVDLNVDGIIDVKDIVIMTHYWGSRYTLCDIGPTPVGDGIVDVRDLLVLAEYIEPEEREPGLIAHWKLDETEGGIVYDGVSGKNAFIIGEPQWQPDSGILDGAVELDGIEDCISTDFVLNPANGPFSVFAWIQGGAPGQVILSQATGLNWLCLDSVQGYLITELIGSGRSAYPLMSQGIITDGNWHRIGFVWDGVNRSLYVDDILLAEDTQTNLQGSDAGLYIGTGKDMESGTYWSGLIDDVRIYNRAVRP
jgi:N-acetylneuraminic acid mutarotase